MKRNKILNLTVLVLFCKIFIIISSDSFAQRPAIGAKSIIIANDTNSIIFKSKLLTITNYGLLLSDSLMLNTLLQQPYKLYVSENQKFYLVEIVNTQSFFFPKDSGSYSVRLMGVGCRYRIIFNTETSKFYRLQGFKFSDFDEFIFDMYPYVFQELIQEPYFSFLTCFSKKKRKNEECDCCVPCNVW